jgi:hypothetical protein
LESDLTGSLNVGVDRPTPLVKLRDTLCFCSGSTGCHLFLFGLKPSIHCGRTVLAGRFAFAPR